jgi:hypothetical protein
MGLQDVAGMHQGGRNRSGVENGPNPGVFEITRPYFPQTIDREGDPIFAIFHITQRGPAERFSDAFATSANASIK